MRECLLLESFSFVRSLLLSKEMGSAVGHGVDAMQINMQLQA